MNVSAFTSFTKYSHLHQVRVLKMFLQDSVISDCKLLKANKLQFYRSVLYYWYLYH